jgi:dipeptidyl aminopeptidase/acylaminoacyl peptidase
LTFALIGVATPSDLIRDKRRTPFNIGRAIELTGFQLQEAQPLAVGLAQKADNLQEVLREILAWTGGQPFLTQKLCKLVLTSPLAIASGSETEVIEQLVRSRIIENWESQDEPEHLRTIRDRILRDEQRAGRRLGLYQQILTASARGNLTPPAPLPYQGRGELNSPVLGRSESGSPLLVGEGQGERSTDQSQEQAGIAADDSDEQMELRLSGLVVEQQGKLRVYNRIYEAVFNQAWVDQVLADLRPYAELITAWLASNCEDESRLLRGQALRDAQAWAADKSLSDLDYQFLGHSQELDKRDVQIALDAERQAKQILAQAQQKAEIALEEERKANQGLVKAQRKTKRQLVIGATILALSIVGAMTAGIVAGKANQDRNSATSQRDKANQDRNSARAERNQASQELAHARKEIQAATEQKSTAQREADKAKQEQQQAQAAGKEAAKEAVRKAQEAQEASQNLATARTELEAVSREAKQKTEDLRKATQRVQSAEEQAAQAQKETQEAEQVRKQAEAQAQQAQDKSKQAETDLAAGRENLRLAQEGTRLEQSGAGVLRQFQYGSVEKVKVLLLAMQVGRELESLVKGLSLKEYPATTPMLALQVILESIDEQDQPNSNRGQLRKTTFQGAQGALTSISFSPDGQRLVTAGVDGTVRIWNQLGQQLAQIPGHPGRVISISVGRDGRLVTAGVDGKVEIWSESGQLATQFQGHQGTVTSVSFNPDGHLVTAGQDGKVEIWSESGQLVSQFQGHQAVVTSMSFSPDGQRLVTLGGDGLAKLWNSSGQLLRELRIDKGWIMGVSFSPDSQRLATAELDGKVLVWNLAGQQLAQFNSYQDQLRLISFSPDGERLATVGFEGTVKLWNLAGRQVAQFGTDESKIVNISFSPDGKQLATVESSGAVSLHSVKDLDELLAQGCNWLKDYRASYPDEVSKLCTDRQME